MRDANTYHTSTLATPTRRAVGSRGRLRATYPARGSVVPIPTGHSGFTYWVDLDGERAVMRLTGMDIKLEQYRKGERFVRMIAEAAGASALRRLWDGPRRAQTRRSKHSRPGPGCGSCPRR